VTTVLVVGADRDAAPAGEGYDVLLVENSEAAEEILLARKPDIALIDLVIEAADAGLVLCHRLKTLYPKTPVIILNDLAAAGWDFTPHSTEQRAWIKADVVLAKPVLGDRLLFEMRRLLGR
jgi:CheY-like chemotaxis protein